jgi:2-polyprenyl-3-methyl-5-hydroxy-6-metoxy-1,4-benzoquinol methylase
MYFEYKEKPSFNPSPNGPQAKIISQINPNSMVLDIGCASGYIARELKAKNCHVIGIEINEKMAREAQEFCDQVLVFDVEEIQELPFKNGSFDVIILADILEHLKRPDTVLVNLKKYLANNGFIIASIPNVARLENRFRLLFGNFDYQEGGILNKGHLRFFTLKTTKELFRATGYEILRIYPTGLGSMLKIWPTLFSFQFLVAARPFKN